MAFSSAPGLFHTRGITDTKIFATKVSHKWLGPGNLRPRSYLSTDSKIIIWLRLEVTLDDCDPSDACEAVF